jgi:DNA-binding beta-propeller fold protein YncE
MENAANQPSLLRRRWKVGLIFLLLGALALVSLVWYQYQTTKQPLQDLSVVPDVLSGGTDPAQFSRSFYGSDGLQRPLGVAVSPSGDRIYVSESDGNCVVRVFGPGGEEIGTLVPPDTRVGTRLPLYVAVAPDGSVYVSDRKAKAIHIYSPEGGYQGTFEPSGIADGGWHPMGLAFDGDGNLYVTDVSPEGHRVMVFDPQGNLTLEIGSEGTDAGQFWYPNGIVVDDRGHLYVADGNNGRVQAFNAQGELLFIIPRGYARGDLAMPRGLALDANGNLVVADTTAHTVKVYEVSGAAPKFLYDFGSHGVGQSGLRFPNGVATDDDRIYVTDRENGRLQVWSY